MRIFLSCQQALRPHPVPAYAFWEYYFTNALIEAGHEIITAPEVDWAEGLTNLSTSDRSAWLERTWTRTVEFLRAERQRRPVDLFLGYLFPEQVDPSAVSAIRAEGIPTVNFFCDNMREFTSVPAEFRNFDLHWVPESEARSMYANAGLPFVYAPMPMWIEPRLRHAPSAESGGIIFAGSRDDLRDDLLGEAVAAGLDVQIYGSGWDHEKQGGATPRRSLFLMLRNQLQFIRREGFHGLAMRETYRARAKRPGGWMGRHCNPPLDGEAYFERTRHAPVVIGINRCPSFRRPFSDPIRYSRLRDIEAPMLGACYLTETAPGLEDLYDVGTEIETYGNAAELVEKVGVLMRDPARRLRLRQMGQRRSLEDHALARSLVRISQKLGLS